MDEANATLSESSDVRALSGSHTNFVSPIKLDSALSSLSYFLLPFFLEYMSVGRGDAEEN